MKPRASLPARLAWDLTHRGASAWALCAVLLGFYVGLYLTDEARRLLAWLGVEAGASHALRVPGPRAWALVAGAGLLAAAVRHRFERDDDPGVDPRPVARAFGAKVSALTAATLLTSHAFVGLFDRPHLLPRAGASWPAWALAALLVPLGAGLAASLAWTLRAWGQRAVMLRRATLPVVLASAAALVLLYGTHALEPAATPEGARSLAAFARRLHQATDSKWGLYGLVYTMAVTAGGVHALGRYGHDRYQVVRTLVVMAVQASFGFSVPVLLGMFRQPEYYLSYFWPLKIDAFYPDAIFRDPAPFVLWSFLGSLVLVPVMGVFFGKRWYCSWVCGCGGLANTAGDPFREHSSKTERAWRIERVTIHATLVLAVVTTVLVVAASVMGREAALSGHWWPGHGAVSTWRVDPARSAAMVEWAARLRYAYGVVVVSVLSGAVGVGLYPLGGTRVWCRFACPMAALLGLVQKFGRYRIRVKEGMCISCGMCSKVCEMGIDVRAYAQADQSFTRAACVGCGMCAEACPRGVLALESRVELDPQERHGGLVQLRRSRDA